MHFPRAQPRGAGRAVGAARSCGASHSRMGEGGVSRASPSRRRWWHKASCVCTGLPAAGGVHVETEALKKSRGKRGCAARSRGSCPGGTFVGACSVASALAPIGTSAAASGLRERLQRRNSSPEAAASSSLGLIYFRCRPLQHTGGFFFFFKIHDY